MTKFKAWISAARLRTLPLSVSGIIVGAVLGHRYYFNQKIELLDRELDGLASMAHESFVETLIFWLAIATTLGLQILSNFANDYGDGVKGTDNEDRVGPQRALQSGAITKKEMFKGIVITAILTLIVAIALIYEAFGATYFFYSVFFFVLGLASIAAAIKYTMGNTAYGYRGLGDVFVFIFFGLVSVVGCYFLYTKNLNLIIFLPAIAIGLLSAAVLNLNNMRDHDSDKKAGKNTLVVKLGIQRARTYHFSLIILAMIAMLTFLYFTYENTMNLLFLIAFIPLLVHIRKVVVTKKSELLDPELKKVALSTFLLSILISIGQIF
ncbi:1,4-dihydroxy-2-naphthoate octaprenyltransferase [Aquimarina sp. 2201CG5-10]|uniref:1,4-dihydroxy-2-naphthoate octaprenyltransferase n=1 Tax=Aquimarina callyspongiae TaxID=3098150 RepID=UPI002AB4FE68|nr:1,4-dihydroxy-2-naphthoate octaprenyltransferase [Aquimarina sp. 2201CG5-10]MDY8136207.1 1,4-dihydroxy-2-naphthoate octaprenyltransferase [Aquimarina sp. 2201CG5-10]